MAGNISDYLETRLLEHSLGKTSFTMPATVAAALFTTLTSGETASYVEVSTSSTSYARVTVSGATWASAVSGAGTITTAADITFPTATGSWGTVVALGLFDSTTVGAGNLLWSGTLTTSKTITNGDIFKIPTGSITISLD